MSGFGQSGFRPPGGGWQSMAGGGWVHPNPLQVGGKTFPYGGMALDLTPKPPFRRWDTPWAPKPPARMPDAAAQVAARRTAEQAQRQAEQARARERAEREARERMERERQHAEQERRLRESLSREQRLREQTTQQHLGDELSRQAALRSQQLRDQRARQQVDAMLEYHRSLGRKWMAERGPFGLSGGLRPVAKVLGKVASKGLEAVGLVAPHPAMAGGAMVLGGQFQKAVDEIDQYEEFLRNQARPEAQGSPGPSVKVTRDAAKSDPSMQPVGEYAVTVAGTLKLSTQDKMVRDIAKAFADRLLEQQSGLPGVSMDKISSNAHKLVQEVDLPDICRKYGMKPHQVEVEPISGVTGSGGGQVRFDVGVFKRRAAMIELKSSGYETERTALQLQAHQIGVGEQTATYGKPGDYYRIYGKERLIEKWTGEDLARALQSQRQPPLNVQRATSRLGKFKIR